MKVQIEQHIGPYIQSPPYDALSECISRSAFHWRGMVDGQVACIWGLIPPTLMSDQAYLWLQCSALVDEHKFLFVRHSQRMLPQLLEVFPTIVGHCTVTSERSIRWIKWLGGTFGEPDGFKVPFVIRKK